MFTKKAETQYPINEILANRWSSRSFNPEKKVEKEKIIAICEAARWAPSCFNDQPWRFMIFEKNVNPDQYKKAFDCLGEWNQKWVESSTVLVAIFANQNFTRNGKPNRWSQSDTGAATMNMILEAESQGLKTHQMGGYDDSKLMEIFNVPKEFDSISVMALGYQAEPDLMATEYKEAELKERKRLPLGETFFDSYWENPII